MAIAFDNSTDGGLVNPDTSITYAHTTSGSDRILFVTAFGDTSDAITGATYNSVAMTLVGKINTIPGVDRWVYLFVLVNPASGANNVVVSASGSIAIASHATSYTGAAQTGQPDSFAAVENDDGGGFTASTTVVAANCWLVAAFRTNSAGGTPGTGATQREASSGLYTADSNGTVGTGSQSMQYTNGGGNGWAAVIASFSEAGGGGGGGNRRRRVLVRAA